MNMLQSAGHLVRRQLHDSILRGQYETLWIVALVVVAVFIAADRFTVAGLGKDIATNVGLNYDRIILIGTILVSIATGIVTVVVGSLPFLGLIVPNIVSMLRGDDLRSNLPWVCLLGIAIVTVCDLIGRVIIMPFEVPVSLILGVVGAAVFVALLLRAAEAGVKRDEGDTNDIGYRTGTSVSQTAPASAQTTETAAVRTRPHRGRRFADRWGTPTATEDWRSMTAGLPGRSPRGLGGRRAPCRLRGLGGYG
jgi:predicted small secreted protein